MELSENDGNYFNLTPLSWEEVSKELEESKKQSMSSSGSPIWSQQVRPVMSTSTISSVTSDESFKHRKNAGFTPKKNLNPKNSIETLRNKLRHESQIAFKENTSTKVFNLDSQERSRYSEHPHTQEHSMPYLTKETNKWIPSSEEKRTQYSSITESTNNRISQAPISQFNLKPNCNKSFITVDETYDSDADMFEDYEPQTETSTAYASSEKETESFDIFHSSRLLANISCQYSEGKFNFAPQSSFDQTYYLEEELYETSRRQIQYKIDQILTFLEE